MRMVVSGKTSSSNSLPLHTPRAVVFIFDCISHFCSGFWYTFTTFTWLCCYQFLPPFFFSYFDLLFGHTISFALLQQCTLALNCVVVCMAARGLAKYGKTYIMCCTAKHTTHTSTGASYCASMAWLGLFLGLCMWSGVECMHSGCANSFYLMCLRKGAVLVSSNARIWR